MTLTINLRHAEFCLPRPGLDQPRVEQYRAPKTAPDGITPAGGVSVVRCLECGNATYDGVQRKS
jgi:hypothetical protein